MQISPEMMKAASSMMANMSPEMMQSMMNMASSRGAASGGAPASSGPQPVPGIFVHGPSPDKGCITCEKLEVYIFKPFWRLMLLVKAPAFHLDIHITAVSLRG